MELFLWSSVTLSYFRSTDEERNDTKQDPIPALRALLGKRPSRIKGEIPILPPADAVQILKARVDLLKFKGGKGLRFLTHYAQDDIPVTNASLFYTYQGLTDDGCYW